VAAAKQQPVKTVKKKIRPYPFDADLDVNGAKKPVEIIYISAAGFLARLKATAMVFVGEYYHTAFELPVMGTFVNVQVRVIKTYDKSIDPKSKKVERMAELHFETLSDEHKKNILNFMATIGQK
jgi:hypothetical protein